MMWRFQKSLLQILNKFNSYVFYYFVMKWCEDFKIHCWKFWKSSILLYSIILWWNDVRISKIIVKKVLKIIICMYFITLLWNDVKISKIFAANFEQV